MADFSLSASMRVMRKTAPFVVFRVIIYFGIAAAYVLATGFGAGVGWGIGAMGSEDFQATSTFYGGLFGLGATAAVLYFLREYILYLVKAGHIAVMVEYLDGKDLPEGRGQIEHAQKAVKERFAEANVLFTVDQLVKGVLRVITGLVQGLASLLPIPGLNSLMSVIKAFLRVAVGLLDEVILAHLIRTKSENPWSGARDALVLYGQNARRMLTNAALIALAVWILSFIVFLVMLIPAGAVVYLIPGAWSAGAFIFAILIAWAVKVSLIEPFAIACLIQAFNTVTEGQDPDPEWSAKLEGASSKFKKLGEKALSYVPGNRSPAA